MALNLGPSSLLEELPTEEELRRQRGEGLSRSSLLAELPTEAELQASAPPPEIGPAPGLTPEDVVDMEEEADFGPPRPSEHGIRLPGRPAQTYPATPFERIGAAAKKGAQEALFAPPMVPTPHAGGTVAEKILAPAATLVAGAAQAAELTLKPITMLFQAGKAGLSQGMRELGFGEADIQSAERDADALLVTFMAGQFRAVQGRPRLQRPRTIEQFSAIVDDFGGKAAREALRSINDPVFKAKAMDYLRQKFTMAVEQTQGAGARERGLALPLPPQEAGAPPMTPRLSPARPVPAPEPPPVPVVEPTLARPMPVPAAPETPEPVVAVPTIPETQETLARQWEALVRGDKPAVLFPLGQPSPTELPGFGSVETDQGTVVFSRREMRRLAPASVPAARVSAWVKEQVEAGRAGLLLGYGVEAKPEPGEPATLVEARGPAGEEVQTVVAPTPPPSEILEAAERVLPPEGGEVVVTPPEELVAGAADVIARRLGRGERAPSPEVVPTGITKEGLTEYRDLPKEGRQVYHPSGLPGRIVGEDAENFYVSRLAGSVAWVHKYPKDLLERAQAYFAEGSMVETREGPGTIIKPPFYKEGYQAVNVRLPDGTTKDFLVGGLKDLPWRKAEAGKVAAEKIAPLPPARAVAGRRPTQVERIRIEKERLAESERQRQLGETKEPWQMTQEEFWRSGAGGRAFEGRGTSDFNHKQAVKSALDAYKRVPPEVLAEYPDLGPVEVPQPAAPSPRPAPARFKITRTRIVPTETGAEAVPISEKVVEAGPPLPSGVTEADVMERIQAIRRTTEDIASGKEPGRVIIYDPEALKEGRKYPIGAVTGGGKTLDLVAEVFDEVSAVADLPPGDLLEAIRKDKENPTYMRLRRAVAEELGKEAQGLAVPQWIQELPSVTAPTEVSPADEAVRELARKHFTVGRFGPPIVDERIYTEEWNRLEEAARAKRGETPLATPSAYPNAPRLRAAVSAIEERMRRGDLPKNPKELRELLGPVMGVEVAKDPAALDDLFDALEVAVNRLHRERRVEGDTLLESIKKASAAEDFLGHRTRTLELSQRQQFSTPLPIAEASAYALDLRAGETVVEPTAGTGNLLAALPSGTSVVANEMDPRRVETLLMQGYPAKQGDALREQLQGSVVLMNSPWGKYSTGRYGQAIPMPYPESVDVAERYVVTALRGIPAGGRLVAVMPTTATGNPSFINWLKETHTLRALIQSPPGAYITRGTDVESVLLVVDKGRTQNAPEPIRAAAASWEDYASLVAPLAAGGSHSRISAPAQPGLARRPPVGAPGPPATAVPGPAQPVPAAPARGEGAPPAPPAGPSAGEPGRQPEAGVRRLPGRPGARAAGPGPGVVATGLPGEPGAPEPVRPGPGLPPEPGGAALPARLQGQRFSAADAAELDAAARSPVFAPAPLRSAPGDSPHPRLIVKTRSLEGAKLPDLTYQPRGRLLPDAYRRKAISDGQWDYGIIPALQANAQGHGFLAASDVGVGKTRMAAAVAAEWLETGQADRVLYVTASEVNIQDVKREFDLYAGGKFPFELVEVKGFMESKERPSGKPEPLPAIPKAVYLVDRYNLSGFSNAILQRGFDAIMGDEAHLLKNIADAAVGKAWLAIQKQTLSRRGKFLYLTATPAVAFDDLEHFVGLREWSVDGFEDYKQAVTGAAAPRSVSELKTRQEDLLSRLSMLFPNVDEFYEWKGRNIKEPKPFEKSADREEILKANLDAVNAELMARGETKAAEAMGGDAEAVGVRAQRRAFFKGSDIFRTAFITPAEQEQIMRELAMKGKYDSVDLWRSGVEFSIGSNPLTPEQVNEYRELADFFRDLQSAWSKFGRLNKRKRMFTIRHFLQAEAKRRMFDYRLGHAIREAKEALARGEQPVISSISVSAGGETTGPIPAAINSINDREVEMDKAGNVIRDEEIPEALVLRGELLERWQAIRTTPDPVQAVQAVFGEDKVAVVTGETPPRLREKVIREFQEGRRPVAFISGAGKTGISLHHILETAGKAKGRRHLIVSDFEWSATTFKQEMGRVDRSGQLSSPKITVLSTGSAGERKFVATIANRMRSLGALSKGSAEAASNDKLAEFEIGGGLDSHAMRKAYSELPNEIKDRFLAGAFRDPNDPSRNTRSYPQAASLKDFLLDLQFMPTAEADLAFEKFWEQRQIVMADQEAAQEELASTRTRTNQGKVLRTTALRPDLLLHEVQDDNGQRFGILQGIVTDYMHLIGPRLAKGPTGLPVRRYTTFRSGDDQVAGLELRPGAMALVARAFGKSMGGRIDTTEKALEALQAGDKLPLQGEAGYVLRMRPSDQRIQIERAKMADRDLLQRHGAGYSPVGNVWFLTPETLPKFLERFPVRKEVEVPSAADEATRDNLRVEEPKQPLLPETPRREMPKEKIRPETEQKEIEDTPLFGQERERRERAAKEAQQELPGIKERAEAYGVDTGQPGWQDRMSEGQRALLAKEPYAVRPEADTAQSRKLAFAALGDLDRAAEGVSRTRGAVVRRGLPGRGVPAGAGARTLGLGITSDLIHTGRVDLRGQTLRSPEDLARLAQVYRDPRFETLRILYVKGETIVAHEGVTSRLPGSSQIFVTKGKPGEEMVRGLYGMARRMDRLGADGYWLVHNHPSGRADMSPDDIVTTRKIEHSVPGFKGHVVIDSGEYGVLGPGEKGPKTVPWPKDQPDPLLAPSVPHDLLNRPLTSETHVFMLARALQTPRGFVTLLYRARDKVRAIQEIPEALFLKTNEVADYIRGRRRAFGGQSVVAISPAESAKTRAAAETLVRSGVLLDYLDLETGQGTGGIPSVREPSPPRGFRVAEAPVELLPSSDTAVERALTSTSARGMPALRNRLLDAYTAFRKATTFEYDLRGLPVERDEFRLFHATRRRVFVKAGEDVVGVVGRLKDAKELAHFSRIVLLRDYRARAADPERFPGGVPEGLTAEQIDTELARLEGSANELVQEAAEAHRRLIDAERADLEARELLDPERAIQDYFPHFVLKHEEPRQEFPIRSRIRQPRRSFLKRARGSEAGIETDYIRAMFRHRTQVRLANAIDDFALGILERLDRRAALPKEVRRALRPGQVVQVDGKPYRAFQYKPGRAIFSAESATEKAIAEAMARGEPAMVPVEELRKIGALGRWNRMYVVPEAVADRFENFAPKEAGTMLRILNRATSKWKGVTIGFWGTAGNVMNLMGDLANMVRQEPAALLALPKATAEVLRWRYGTGSDLTKLMEAYDVLSSGYVANEIYFRTRAPELRQFLSKAQRAKHGALNRVGGLLTGGILGAAAGGPGGAVVGGTIGAALGARGILREVPEVREAIPRTAMAIAQLRRVERGAPLRGRGIAIEGLPAEQAAMKIAREFTVDYSKFTPDEDRLLRGLLLPFYAWAKTNTVNWLRYMVYAPFGFLGFLGLRFLLEAWNNQDEESQKVEQSLPPYKRQQAHVVTGWKDKDGKVIVVYYAGDPMADALGWVGLGGSLNRISDLMTERIEPGRFASQQMRAFVADPGQRMVNLLTPMAKVPIEMSMGRSALTGQEIVPRALEGTPEAFRRRLRHGAESAFRPLREVRKLRETAGGEEGFDWLSNRWGLGIPVERVDPERATETVAMQQWFEAKAEFVEQRLHEFRQSEEFAKLSARQQEAMLRDKAERATDAFRRLRPFPVSRQRRLLRRMQ